MNKNSLWMAVWGLGWSVAMVSATTILQAADENTVVNVSDKKNSYVTTQQKMRWHDKKQVIEEPEESAEEMMSSRFQIGGDYTRVQIKPKGLPSFKGNLGGAQASYEYRPKNSFYGALTANWKQGSTHGTDGKRKLLYVDVQERFGYTYGCPQDTFSASFFTGLGYRHLGHKFIPNAGSLLYFRYNELYVPVGVLTDYIVNSWFAIGLDFTWMPQVYPTVSIVPLRGARWILTETLTNFFVDLPIDFTLTKSKSFHIILKPFYERWKDGHSTAETSTGIPLGLPGNTYNFWGVDVNFSYCF